MLSVFMLAWLSLLNVAIHASHTGTDNLFWFTEFILVFSCLIEAGYAERGDPITRTRRVIRIIAVLVFFSYMIACVLSRFYSFKYIN